MIRKFISLALFAQLVCLPIAAQTTLTYSSHGMQEDDIVNLTGISDATAGNAGAGQLWDYSGAQLNEKTFTISYQPSSSPDLAGSQSFACQQTDDVTVLMTRTPNAKLYTGMRTPQAEFSFNEPIKELVYPFAYGDKISGIMDGTYTTLATGQSEQIDGTYTVEADAWGTLVLPNGVTLPGVLRVKYTKKYTQLHYDALYNINVEHYLFYSAVSRYPVLQIKHAVSACDCGCHSDETTAFFNADVQAVASPPAAPARKLNSNLLTTAGFTYKLSPNPFESRLQLDYTLQASSKIKVELLSLSGSLLKTLLNTTTQEAGSYSIAENLQSLATGTYVLQIVVDGRIYSEKVIKE